MPAQLPELGGRFSLRATLQPVPAAAPQTAPESARGNGQPADRLCGHLRPTNCVRTRRFTSPTIRQQKTAATTATVSMS